MNEFNNNKWWNNYLGSKIKKKKKKQQRQNHFHTRTHTTNLALCIPKRLPKSLQSAPAKNNNKTKYQASDLV